MQQGLGLAGRRNPDIWLLVPAVAMEVISCDVSVSPRCTAAFLDSSLSAQWCDAGSGSGQWRTNGEELCRSFYFPKAPPTWTRLLPETIR